MEKDKTCTYEMGSFSKQGWGAKELRKQAECLMESAILAAKHHELDFEKASKVEVTLKIKVTP